MLDEMKHVSHDVLETQKIARVLAEQLVKKCAGKPIVIALEGELGAGKTIFVQAFAEALGVPHRLKSPTFVLMKHYQLHNVAGYEDLYHLDCYRLQDAKDLIDLSIEDILNKGGNIVLIEWAERVAKILPIERITIFINHIDETTREISIN